MRSIIDGERKQTAAAIQVAMQLEEKGARRSQMETKGEKKERNKAENTHTHSSICSNTTQQVGLPVLHSDAAPDLIVTVFVSNTSTVLHCALLLLVIGRLKWHRGKAATHLYSFSFGCQMQSMDMKCTGGACEDDKRTNRRRSRRRTFSRSLHDPAPYGRPRGSSHSLRR